MLKMLRKIINSQAKKRRAYREKGLLLSKFSDVENELSVIQKSEEKVVMSLSEDISVDISTDISSNQNEVVANTIVQSALEITQLQPEIKIEFELENKDSWKIYSESITDALNLDSQDFDGEDAIVWYQESSNSSLEDSVEENLIAESVFTPIDSIEQVKNIEEEVRPIIYFQNMNFDFVEETILKKFSFIKHENLEIKLNKHLNKENVSIHFKLEDKKEMGLINKLLPSLVQDLGLNLITEVFKSKSNLAGFKVVLKEGLQKKVEDKKKENRDIHV